jgi:hypothetical protein
MNHNNRLSDILANGNRDSLAQAWDTTKAAEDFAPLPSGEYVAHVIGGELSTSRHATPGYKLTFKVIEGEHVGRQFWHDLWLTPAALPMAKRDLAKIGVTVLEQLEQPLPQGIRCKVKLALRKDDGGVEHNKVRSFEVIGIDPPEAEPFAPVDVPQDGNDAGDTSAPLPEVPKDGIPI